MCGSVWAKIPAALITMLLLAAAHVQPGQATDAEEGLAVPKTAKLPYDNVGRIEKTAIAEPSGIVYHPGRRTLFVVGDEGHVTEIGLDGRLVQAKHLRYADLEGITCNPETGLLYVAVEGDEQILEVDPATLDITRPFDLPRTWHGDTVLASGGQGIEAITFVPAQGGGGTFYVANQGPKRKSKDDGPGLAEFALPLEGASGGEAIMLRWFPMEEPDLAGLAYDPREDRLFVVSDRENLLMVVSREGKIIERYHLPGEDQEGIAFDNEGNLYIAQDSGGILKLVRE